MLWFSLASFLYDAPATKCVWFALGMTALNFAIDLMAFGFPSPEELARPLRYPGLH